MKFCRAAVTQKDPGRGPISSFLLADTGFISRLSVSADNKSCHFGRILVSAKMKKLHVSRAYVKAVSMDGWTEHRHEVNLTLCCTSVCKLKCDLPFRRIIQKFKYCCRLSNIPGCQRRKCEIITDLCCQISRSLLLSLFLRIPCLIGRMERTEGGRGVLIASPAPKSPLFPHLLPSPHQTSC